MGGRHPFVEAIEENQQVKLEGQLSEFANSCKLNKFSAPTVVVKADKGRDRTDAGILFDVGQALQLDATPSTPKGTAKELKFMWVISAPEDSAKPPAASFKNQLSYQPDATGMYIYSVIAKDEFGFCQLDMQPFYVTANYQFDPTQSLPENWYERLDPNTFWHVFHVGSQQSWTRALGRNQIVGVIDSGVDYNHPALSSNVYVNTREVPGNGRDDDGNGFVDDVTGYDFGNDDGYPVDDYGHGTHVAGIAASHVFGAARKAQILPTKFGSGVGFDMASVTGAIKYSVDSGATVLNMSFGWEEDLAVVREAMNYAERKGVLVVAASGNDGANNDTVGSYPCNYSNANIISVAASDENDKLTFYSNYGQKVHIAAPGGTPEKPIMSSYKKNPKDSQIVGLMGTSMASPLVAGVAAQVWSANPQLTAVQVKALLMETGKPAPAIGNKIRSGKVIDASAALDKVLQTGLGSSSTL
jgi:subtilisin family serine protease